MYMENFAQKICNWDELFSSEEFEKEYAYDGNDLGCTYTSKSTCFRVWAPTAANIQLNIFEQGIGDNLIKNISMNKSTKGTWFVEIEGDWKNKFYTYSIKFDNVKVTNEDKNGFDVNLTYVDNGESVIKEAVDIYAKAVGVNGQRGMIVDLEETNPDNWNEDKSPEFKNYTDAVIYELHVRDLSMDSNSGIKNSGKFLGIAETGTKTPDGYATGIDHIKELGITHVHLLPVYDFGSIDETGNGDSKFNWGYDPVNYNVPEGSYATDAYDGKVRIKEFKQMVKGMHDNGLRVIMDVVYNHTYNTIDSNFDKIVPNYYHRNKNGKFSNGSGCGNETASDRIMFRKFMIDSLKYWAKEYHIDGFRFDLMAVHDFDTMNLIKKELMDIDESIIIYGEGWIGGNSIFDSSKACFKVATQNLNDIAVFNDDIRDAIKGSIMDAEPVGFASGAMYKENHVYSSTDIIEDKIKFGMAGSVKHPQVNGVEFEKRPEDYDGSAIVFWAKNPTQTINYISAHDNWTLWDKLQMSCKEESVETKKRMNKFAAAMVFMAQGIPFIHAGEELLRTKVNKNKSTGFEEDSFRSPDEMNMLKWADKARNKDIFEYYKGLITFRKEHSVLRLTTADKVRESVRFVEGLDKGLIAFSIKNVSEDEKANEIFIIFNGLNDKKSINLPNGQWNVYINGEKAGNEILAKAEGTIEVEPLCATVLLK